MAKNKIIDVQGHSITVITGGQGDFISLTDMAKRFGGDDLIYNWMRNRNTIEFLGIWEQIHNPDFKGVEFDTFKKEAGLNSFTLTPRKWIDATDAVGIQSRAGRYSGGTYAHRDLAFEFGSWLSPEFKLYLIKEFFPPLLVFFTNKPQCLTTMQWMYGLGKTSARWYVIRPVR